MVVGGEVEEGLVGEEVDLEAAEGALEEGLEEAGVVDMAVDGENTREIVLHHLSKAFWYLDSGYPGHHSC